MKRFIIAITGASGAIYAKRLFDYLQHRAELHLVVSDRGWELVKLELGINREYFKKSSVTIYRNSCMDVGIASGSFPADGMVIVPASMGTIGRIASGVSETVIERAADVCLKERVKLVVVPRETPLSTIHLRNLTLLDQAGALILPASPGFYNKPQGIGDLVDFVVARILKQLGVDQDLIPSYKPE